MHKPILPLPIGCKTPLLTGRYYMSGNSTPISNGVLVNCQQVRYSANWVYVNATGMPAYKVGPFT
jgi:hypothetical protein